MKRFYVQINLTNEKEDCYGERIESYKKVDSFPEGEIINPDECSAVIADYDWIYSESEIGKNSDRELDEEARYLVEALRYIVVNENEVVLEFNQEQYAKFCYVAKKDDKGIYLCCQ